VCESGDTFVHGQADYLDGACRPPPFFSPRVVPQWLLASATIALASSIASPPRTWISCTVDVAASLPDPSPVTDPLMSLTTIRRPPRREQESVLAAQASACAGDHGNAIVEPQLVGRCHHVTGSSFMP
jgi:hypothetical protein